MTASPLAGGSFQRAIGESGGAFGQRETGMMAEAELQVRTFGEKLGVKTLAELRAKTTDELFAAKPPRFEDQARDRYGARAVDFSRLFPAATDAEARSSAKASGTLLFGDFNSTTWARLQARSGKARIYQYRFVHAPHQSQNSAGPPRNGAYHGAEIPYAFHNLHLETRPCSDIDRRLETQLSSYWVNFARSGDPNGRDLPHWPSVQEERSEVLQLGDAVRLVDRPNSSQIAFFEHLFYEPGGLYAAATCLVSGIIERRTGADGQAYGIRFEMRWPDHWNGRFLFQGGGGTNGAVRPAIGQVKGPAALLSGFAVVTQDAGHEGADSSFGADQQARIDMIYRSYERVTGVAKSLIAAYYGKPADGTIIVLDDLVKVLADDGQVVAVLAHELGHVHGRHGLQQLLKSSAVGAVLTLYAGDVSGLLAAAPAALVQARYSQEFEREADNYGAAVLIRNGLSPGLLADALGELSQAHPHSANLQYLATHPATDERIKRLRALAGPPNAR